MERAGEEGEGDVILNHDDWVGGESTDGMEGRS